MAEGLSGDDRDRIMMIEGRVLKPEDKIHDLVDILDTVSGFRGEDPGERRDGPEIIHELVDVVDVVERKPRMALVDTGLHDEIVKRAQEIAEKVAREIIPDIAERVIRERGEGPILDPLAFIEAEIELGLPGPVTFGRVAVGLCLVCATTEDAKPDYVCDDVVEEMRYSGWLIGRDADRRVLIELLRALQQSRRGPAKEAA